MTQNLEEVYHVYPMEDIEIHTASSQCWCQPSRDVVEPDLWIHNRAMDKVN